MNIPSIDLRLINNELRISAIVIADNTNNTYESVRDRILKYKSYLTKIGDIPTTVFKTAVGKEAKKVAMLNEQQAAFLMTLLRNTKEIVEFKFNLVTSFFKMRKELESKKVHHITIGYKSQITQHNNKIRKLEKTIEVKDIKLREVEYSISNAHDKYRNRIIELESYSSINYKDKYEESRKSFAEIYEKYWELKMVCNKLSSNFLSMDKLLQIGK